MAASVKEMTSSKIAASVREATLSKVAASVKEMMSSRKAAFCRSRTGEMRSRFWGILLPHLQSSLDIISRCDCACQHTYQHI